MSKTKLEIDMPSELLFLLRETEESFKEDVVAGVGHLFWR